MFDLVQMLECDPNLQIIVNFVKSIFNLVQLGVPIILIVMGTIDLGKAVLSSDEKEIKGATGKLIKRCIAAVAVFFVTTIVRLVIGLVADANTEVNKSGWEDCWSGTDSSKPSTDADSEGR